MNVLSKNNPEVHYVFGNVSLVYHWDEFHDSVLISLHPTRLADKRVANRGASPIHPFAVQFETGSCWGDRMSDSLVQIHVRGDGLGYPASCNGWSAGMTMRNSQTTNELTFVEQKYHDKGNNEVLIETVLETKQGLRVTHHAFGNKEQNGFLSKTSVYNPTNKSFVLENLSSFSIGKISPFATDDMPERMKLHRIRSAWSLEGRHESQLLEDLHLERYWGEGGANTLKFGQIGSLPVRQFFPFIGIEDTDVGVLWGAQIAWHGSWQMEFSRRDDPISISGGLADYDTGQWAKTLKPNESFDTPDSIISCCEGRIDHLCNNLTTLQDQLAFPEPESESELPIIFNEWCSSWGNPTHDNVIATCRKLLETETKIFVIDDGWSSRPEGFFQCNGSWVLDTKKFPNGIKATTDEILKMGLIPGIWFEFEVATEGNEAFELTDHQLKRHGQTVQVGKRHFWDLRDPWTQDYLYEKVIKFLKDNNFGYLKVDYNDSIGLGCDPVNDTANALGEGLREHLAEVKNFFKKIRTEIPGICVENCASGGHRIEPGMISLTSMSSFSDAHECLEIPIVAANLHRVIHPKKNQIWCVFRKKDTLQRLAYSLSATFLGRMVISGDLNEMNEESFNFLKDAQIFYKSVTPIIRSGTSFIHQEGLGKSYRYPKGWQAVVRYNEKEDEVLIVLHTFEEPPQSKITLNLISAENWGLTKSLSPATPEVNNQEFKVLMNEPFSANVFHLTKKS